MLFFREPERLEVFPSDADVGEGTCAGCNQQDCAVRDGEMLDRSLGMTSPTISGRPEEEARAASEVVLRNESEESAICTHGVVIAHEEIHFFRNGHAVFLDEGFVEGAISFERCARVLERNIGI